MLDSILTASESGANIQMRRVDADIDSDTNDKDHNVSLSEDTKTANNCLEA